MWGKNGGIELTEEMGRDGRVWRLKLSSIQCDWSLDGWGE